MRKRCEMVFCKFVFLLFRKVRFYKFEEVYKEIVKISKFLKEKSREKNLFGIINNKFRRIFKKSFEM